ncbi:DNA polymerase IV [Leptospira kobayashii]|uniref:DNA polymerase IV n=2 Tax=Leptospira kobayashii TaxID=1917830 RepID=A0ABM7UT58_9LEPT|nr:DNA polymerase IV [Leptospira kobayashii]
MRKIIHIDMDAFYASVEQRDKKEWKGLPVVVGGPPNSRAVVCAASYEARKFGIRSAMPCYQAFKLCPEAIFTPPRFDAYRKVSYEIREIFSEYTDLIEPLSLDEAYLDVTENKKNIPHATTVAKEIREKVFHKTDLTCSAGVSSNKFLAKMASEKNKPNGLAVILPEDAGTFLANLSLSKFHGIGKKTFEKMQSMGLQFGKDLLTLKEEELISHFGKMGRSYFYMARGLDDRPVVPYRDPKSIGVETTFEKDSDDFNFLYTVLDGISKETARRLEKKDKKGKTLTLKIKYADFTNVSRSITSERVLFLASDLLEQSSSLLASLWKESPGQPKKVRLIGISISNLNGNNDLEIDDGQLKLF